VESLNLGIIAHVDAGKTTLTERLLFAAGVIDAVGSVDDGSTQTDTLALERTRGITIRSAVVAFRIGDVTVNLIDTPGHPDFIAEVERVLGVLDGAVLVVSAVEGVQAQTRVLMRVLHRLRIPTVVFVNKVDRMGARPDDVTRELRERLGLAVVPMGRVVGAGSRAASVVAYDDADAAFRDDLAEALAEHDEVLLADAVERPERVTGARLRRALAAQTAECLVSPVFFGSAITGAGTDELRRELARVLPTAPGGEDGPLSAAVFKVDRGAAGEKVAYARLFSGAVRVRDVVRVGAGEAKVTGIRVFEPGAVARRPSASAGQIAQLSGLSAVRVGDVVGVRPGRWPEGHQFSPPALEAVVEPVDPHDRGRLFAALTRLAEADPLIDVRSGVDGETWVSLYGEVQKEVIAATLASEHGVAVTFRSTSVICVERPVGVGRAVEIIGTPGNPFAATVGLRVEPGRAGSGVTFHLDVELGSLLPAHWTAIEGAVRRTLRQGLHGWAVVDAVVTVTHCGYWSPVTVPADFRGLTPLVLMAALVRAGTQVLEPIHRFDLEIPADVLSPVLTAIARLRGVPRETRPHASGWLVSGDLPSASMHDLQVLLPGLARGEAVLVSTFDRYEPAAGPAPSRQRTDDNPLNRNEYLARVAGRPG
jgi:ribosomal protection tetracycline resistance protein